MMNLKIGITISINSVDDSIWTNGIKLNTLIMALLLKKSTQNYDVCLLNTGTLGENEKPKYVTNLDIHKFTDKFMDMDLIIVLGAQVHEDHLNKFRSLPNKKVVSYKCGNNYIIHTENVIFKPSVDAIYQYETAIDEIWYIPQQHETNSGFYRTLHRTNSLTVPFIWHHKFIFQSIVEIEKEKASGNFKKNFKYVPNKEKKVIGTMEPNINIVKYGMIPTMIAEESYRTDIGKNKIEKMLITNSDNIANNKEFLSIIKTFDMFKDNKIFAEKRYQTVFMVSQFLDIVVCHQLLNPLKYIYLDVAFMGYPVLHNAPMVKDLGYYYEGSDTLDGSKKLNWILENHDNNLEEYSARNEKVLWRYNAENPNLIKTYDTLINNLFNGKGNDGLIYNPSTNLYDNLEI